MGITIPKGKDQKVSQKLHRNDWHNFQNTLQGYKDKQQLDLEPDDLIPDIPALGSTYTSMDKIERKVTVYKEEATATYISGVNVKEAKFKHDSSQFLLLEYLARHSGHRFTATELESVIKEEGSHNKVVTIEQRIRDLITSLRDKFNLKPGSTDDLFISRSKRFGIKYKGEVISNP